MIAKSTRNLKRRWAKERGVVLIACLMFIALILPITLLILDTVRIESLLPVNEAYMRTAGDEADKGFAVAMAAIIADQSPRLIDLSADYADTDPNPPPYFINTDPDAFSGKHEFDYLSERWARHPDNDTIFLVERSLENWDGGSQDEHSVPARWQLMNVPFGMDDFGEYYHGSDNPRLLLPFEFADGSGEAPAYYVDPSELSMLFGGEPEGESPSKYASEDLADGFWQLSPADPNYYTDLNNLTTIVQFIARPASYFRNTGATDFIGIASVGLPSAYGDAPGEFVRENNNDVDRLVYDGFFDYDGSIWPDNPVVTQYLPYLPLQNAVAESAWANKYFGSTGASGNLAAMFVSSNREYKPAPGAITKYQLGSDEDDAVPGWYETIVSDESGRFPINRLMNIIYASNNVDYFDDVDVPASRRDQFDLDWQGELIGNTDHPNWGGYLLARDILISLLISDVDMARLGDSFDNAVWQSYINKADYILRHMLERRAQLDQNSDINRNGDYSDDETIGEIFQYPEMFQNNDSTTLDIDPPPGDDLMDGNGRMGDGQDMWDGTWPIYNNPKELLSNFRGLQNSPMTFHDFETLNQRVTVYSMDTEHSADPEHEDIGFGGIWDTRHNINRMQPQDDFNTTNVQEDALWNYLDPIIGTQRLQSIINWRDGLVDLNGDGDLDDEFIEQPVSTERYDMDNDTYAELDGWPVSQITYREKDHPNFQDPALEPAFIDPDLLNLRNMGDLLMVPMSTGEGMIAFNRTMANNDPVDLIVQDEGNNEFEMTDMGRMYPEFRESGTGLAYDDESEIYTNDNDLTNENPYVDPGKHPSYGGGDTFMVYYEGDDLHMVDIAAGTDTVIVPNADFPLDIDDTDDAAQVGGPLWPEYTPDIFGQADLEMASPDASPNAAMREACFSQKAQTSNDIFMDEANSAYNLVSVNVDTLALDTLIDNPMGQYDYAPDYSPDGQSICFTRTTYYNFLPFIGEPFDSALIPTTNLYVMPRTGGFAIPVFGEWWLIEDWLPGDTSPFTFRLHQPMYPSWSADGDSVIFMDVVFEVMINTAPDPDNIVVQQVDSNLYTIEIGDLGDINPIDWYQPWWNANLYEGDADFSNDIMEMFPDWGMGRVLPGYQQNFQNGDLPARPMDLTLSAGTDGPFDETERELIAQALGGIYPEPSTSLAFRSQEGSSQGLGGQDQNWTYRDLPVVPSHMVTVLERVADIVSFREPLTEWVDVGNIGGLLQEYPGNININTASREVLRSVFLMMFQGHVYDIDDNGGDNGPMPRFEGAGVGNDVYINLRSTTGANAVFENRFRALMIADKYAQQVVEYRKWVYNNQGMIGVTDETVGSDLPLYEAEFPDTSHYGNFRGNPFYPLSDTDGDPDTLDMQRQDPDPPFRSIADLFKVMLFDDQEFSEDWTFEGIDSANGGPAASDLPEPRDVNDAPVGSVDALEVYGPIYNAENERQITHARDNALLGGGVLTGFEVDVDNDLGSGYFEHQAFRLFSADDFSHIAPWLTTRTYNYRIESRGVIRVAAAPRRTDVMRDKVWIITMNTEAFEGTRENPTLLVTDIYDTAILAQNDGMSDYYVLYFEETPQAGIAVSRSEFLP